ncbi:hypothetical protein HYU07_01615 [Candidatus Woesearchaeota archaeon]|nr:hypothetical protein [Candidatus Woesearchaeota archaeon]
MKKLSLFLVLIIVLSVYVFAAANLTVDEGKLLKVKVNAYDPDKDKVTISYAPPLNSKGEWRPDFNQSGDYRSFVSVSDGEFVISEDLNIKVIDIDRPPIFNPARIAAVNETQDASFDASAYDLDGDHVTISAVSLPEGAVFVNDHFSMATGYDTVKKNWFSRLIDNLPFVKISKTFNVKLKAIGRTAYSEKNFKVKVYDANRQPVLAALAPITVNEGEEVVINASAADPDNDKIKYSYRGWMDSNKKTTGYDDAGVHIVTVKASDGFLSDSKDVSVIVNNVNRAPVFDPIKNAAVKEGDEVIIDLKASDPDGDAPIFSSPNVPYNSSLTENRFIYKPNYGVVSHEDVKVRQKKFNITFTARDSSGLNATQNFTLTVKDANRAPVINDYEPAGEKIKAYVGAKVRFSVNASDPDNDNLTYSWHLGFLDTRKGKDAITRKFTASGTKKISVTVSDGQTTAKKEWVVEVLSKKK